MEKIDLKGYTVMEAVSLARETLSEVKMAFRNGTLRPNE